MRIYLVQHGAALSKEVDPQRHLSPGGAAEVEKVAAFLRPLRLRIETAWHSGKPRARQTAEILAKAFIVQKGLIQRDDLEPEARVGPLRQAVGELSGDVLIVGHLPLLSKLAGALVAGDKAYEAVVFRYAGVVCLDRRDDDRWAIAWMLLPEMISD